MSSKWEPKKLKEYLEHVSFSCFETLERCEEQWKKRYLEGIKSRPAGAMILGSSGHTAIAHDLTPKIETYKDLPKDEILDCARDDFVQRSEEDIDWEGEKPVKVRDRLLRAVGAVYDTQLPKIQPKTVESKHVGMVQGIELVAYVDYTGENETNVNHIGDWKFSRAKKSVKDVQTSLQLIIYAWLLDIMDVFINSVTLLKGGPVVTPVGARVSPVMINKAHRRMFSLLKTMEHISKTGDARPAVAGHWICQPDRCGYWDRCVHGGKNNNLVMVDMNRDQGKITHDLI